MAGKPTDRPRLMLVTDRLRAGDAILRIIDSAVDAGVDIVQIREKDMSHADLLAYTRQILSVVDGRAYVGVNSDSAIALECGIGLHLPESAPMLDDDLAERLGPDVLVGRSIHSWEAGFEERVDYLLYGHVFATRSKPGQQARGLDTLASIVERSTKPVWAIGGITPENAASVIEHGAKGVAVIGAILDAPDTRTATLALRAAIDRATRFTLDGTRNAE